MIRMLGFFRELPHGKPDGPSLRQAVEESTGEPPDPRLVAYLDAAPVIAVTGTLVDDVLDPSRRDVAPLEVRTEGLWVWPADFSYYLKTYNLAAPAELLQRAEALGWRPPNLTDDDLMEVDRMLTEPSA